MGKDTYVSVGNKEDISDIITNICPKDTPFYSSCGKGAKATATYHEWLEDTLRDPAANKKVEGFTYAVADPVPRARLGNYTQIFAGGYGVTATQEAVAKHGVTSEISYQMAKAMKEIAMDVEYALITQKTKNAGSAIVAREMGGVQHWITTNKLTNSSARLFTEELLNTALQQCWKKGGNPTKVYLSGGQKRNVSTWSGGGIGEKHMDQNSKKLITSIAVYESDFGVVSFVPHRMMADDIVFVIDPNYWKVAELRKMKTEDLPKDSDGFKKHIVGELTLEARAEKASAIIDKLALTVP